MTFFSNYIYRLTEQNGDELFADLSLDRHGAGSLAQWAEQSGIDRSKFKWVDNCWLKVLASPSDVGLYLDTVLDSESAGELKARLEPDGAYRIEAEEF